MGEHSMRKCQSFTKSYRNKLESAQRINLFGIRTNNITVTSNTGSSPLSFNPNSPVHKNMGTFSSPEQSLIMHMNSSTMKDLIQEEVGKVRVEDPEINDNLDSL